MPNNLKKKTWVKSKEVIVKVGTCKHCKEEILNTDSFVSFYPKGHSHYICMKNDDEKRSESNGE
jgi:hypothetical protein